MIDNKDLIEAVGDMMPVVIAAERFAETDADFFTNSKLEAELRRVVSLFRQSDTYKKMRGYNLVPDRSPPPLEARICNLEERVKKLAEAVLSEEERSALYCEHANEVPSCCNCDANCYCKGRTCYRRGSV